MEQSIELTDVRSFLLWCVIGHYALLLIWFGFFVFGHRWLYRLHNRWFSMTRETFDALHYALLGIFEVLVLVFFLVPLVVLYLTG